MNIYDRKQNNSYSNSSRVRFMQKSRLLSAFLAPIVLVCTLFASQGLYAGTIVLFTDINSMDTSTVGRDQILTNLLGAGTNVLVSKQNDASYNTDFAGFYNDLPGVTGTFSAEEISSGTLAGVDLLFLNNGCCTGSGQPYSIAEIADIASFVSAGGTLGIVAEPCCGGDLPGINELLAGVGSSMTVGAHNQDSGSATILSTWLTAGVVDHSINTFNPIIGGEAAVTLGGQTAIAFEGEVVNIPTVPVPAIDIWGLLLLMTLMGLGGLVFIKHQQSLS